MIKTADIFQNGMILQREKPIRVWGSGDPGHVVEVRLEKQTGSAVVDETGSWEAELPAVEKGENMELHVRDMTEGTLLVIRDIAVGEVWIAAGQSNMEFFLGFDADAGEILQTFSNEHIRFYDIPEIGYEGEEEEYDYREFGKWRKAEGKNLPWYSAVGFYFAGKLYECLQIPIGVIGCNWGGTPACTWLDPAYLKGNRGQVWVRDYERALENLDIEKHIQVYKNSINADRTVILTDPELIRKMKTGLSREEQLQFLEEAGERAPMGASDMMGPCNEARPGALYEYMVKKIAPYGVRGVLWYQGESDEPHADCYEDVFGSLICCWRDLWKENLPFLCTQLAPFGEWMILNGDRFPVLRRAQEQVCNNMEQVWLCSSSDCGMQWDIHPKHKKPIGQRLALLAEKYIYKMEHVMAEAPRPVQAVWDDRKILVKMENGDGLHFADDNRGYISLFDTMGRELKPNRIYTDWDFLIFEGIFPDEVSVFFAQTGYYQVSLYNRSQIPAMPFTLKLERGKQWIYTSR